MSIIDTNIIINIECAFNHVHMIEDQNVLKKSPRIYDTIVSWLSWKMQNLKQ